MAINIDIQVSNRKKISQKLNEILSDQYMLYTKLQKFHWNVEGVHFVALHELFNNQYDELQKMIDRTAERVRALDHVAYGTLAEFSKHSILKEHPGKNPTALHMVKELLSDQEAVIRRIRAAIYEAQELEDEGTANMLTDMMEEHEKMAWMLRATAA